MGFLGNPGVERCVTRVTASSPSAVCRVPFGSAARVTSAAASKAAGMLGFGVSVTVVTPVTPDSILVPAHSENRLAGIVPLHVANDPGCQDIQPHRAVPRDLDRLGSFAVAGGDDQPALNHCPRERRSIESLGDFAPPLLWQHHVFPRLVIVAPTEPSTIDHALGGWLPRPFEPRTTVCLDVRDHLAD